MSLKSECYAVMVQAYAQASDNGRLPVPARQMYYAVRRESGLDTQVSDALNEDPERTWDDIVADIVREAIDNPSG